MNSKSVGQARYRRIALDTTCPNCGGVIPWRSRRSHYASCTNQKRMQCAGCGRTVPCEHKKCPNRVTFIAIPRAGFSDGELGQKTLAAAERRAEFFFWDRFVRELRPFENTEGGGRAVRMAEEKRAAAFVQLGDPNVKA